MPNDPKAEKKKVESEEREIQERTSPGGYVVYEAVRQEGLDELKRSNSALAWSGLAAGLSMAFSLLSEGILDSRLPDAPWRPLIAKFGYCVGFLVVVLGRQQLFTENTLTVILPSCANRLSARSATWADFGRLFWRLTWWAHSSWVGFSATPKWFRSKCAPRWLRSHAPR
jgi:hypothetical protein